MIYFPANYVRMIVDPVGTIMRLLRGGIETI